MKINRVDHTVKEMLRKLESWLAGRNVNQVMLLDGGREWERGYTTVKPAALGQVFHSV